MPFLHRAKRASPLCARHGAILEGESPSQAVVVLAEGKGGWFDPPDQQEFVVHPPKETAW
jgi:hypothetical protein